jgi:hypothetical protein
MESKVSNLVRPSVYPGIDRRMFLTGLIDADITFWGAPGAKTRFVQFPFSRGHGDYDKFLDSNVSFENLGNGRFLVQGITGSLMVAWGDNETYRDVYKWQ